MFDQVSSLLGILQFYVVQKAAQGNVCKKMRAKLLQYVRVCIATDN